MTEDIGDLRKIFEKVGEKERNISLSFIYFF